MSADAGNIKATLDFDATDLDRSVNAAMSRAAQTVSTQVEQSMTQVESRVSSGFKGVGASIFGALGINTITDGLTRAGKFILDIGKTTEEALNQFKAVSGATEEQMKSVSEEAIDLGNDLTLPGTSAVDAAQAMAELAKAGFSVEESQAAARGTLELATAAQTDAANAATIAASAINAFNLKASDSAHVADVLANAANLSAADIQGISDSLQQAGAVAHASGLSLTETAGAIALMANNSIQGSDAGTSLKTMLVALQKPSSEAQRLMHQYGIEIYDNHGKMKSLADIVDAVGVGLKGTTEKQRQFALATIFGTDAVRAINVMLAEGGDGLRKMEAGLNKEGAAAKLAAANSHGFGGALEALHSNIESIAIEIYDKAEPSMDHWLRGVLARLPETLDKIGHGFEMAEHTIGPLVEMVASLVKVAAPGVFQGFYVGLVAIAAVARTAGYVLEPLANFIEDNEAAIRSVVSPLIAATIAYKLFTSAVRTLNSVKTATLNNVAYSALALGSNLNAAGGAVTAFKTKASSMFAAMGGPWGVAIAAVSVGLGLLSMHQSKATADVDALTDAFNKQTGAVTKNVREILNKNLVDNGAFDIAKKYGVSLELVTKAAMGNSRAIGEIRSKFIELRGTLNGPDAFKVNTDMGKLLGLTHETGDAFDEAAHKAKLAAEANRENAHASKEAAEGVSRTVSASRDLASGNRDMAIATLKAKGAMGGEADEAYHARDAVLSLKNAELKGLNAKLDFAQATIDLKNQLKELTKENHHNRSALNLNKQAGIDTYKAFLNLAQSSKGVEGGMKKARAQIFAAALSLTGSRKEALAVTNQFFKLKGAADKVPHNVTTHVSAPGASEATATVDHLTSALVALTQRTWVAKVKAVKEGEQHADGGPIVGPGTGTSDSIPAMLSNGEHVWTAAEVRAAGGHGAVEALRQRALAHQLRSGGPVSKLAPAKTIDAAAALVENLSVSVGDKRDLPDALDETLFHLRRIKRGGRYKTT